ncbi:Protein of unknown function [Gryllus bimaculatus]|nr:Protein of unknown function [Gryllus bimaculatus]
MKSKNWQIMVYGKKVHSHPQHTLPRCLFLNLGALNPVFKSAQNGIRSEEFIGVMAAKRNFVSLEELLGKHSAGPPPGHTPAQAQQQPSASPSAQGTALIPQQIILFGY